MKIILGAGNTTQDGWISLQEDELNMLKEEDFQKYAKKNEVDAFLSEHVFEHLNEHDGRIAAKNIFKYLRPGGYIRLAVPDKNFENDKYQNIVKIGGPGPIDHPAASHKIVYDYLLLKDVFESAGFTVNLLEYCDENKNYHYKYWNEDDGKIGRSYRFDTRNFDNTLGFTSIIMDAHKPLIIKHDVYSKI
ncbi:methyltransferase domain-containing protein [Macrococcus epidermidis]|uniref:class I SAM-dependent methyltransferase n=1 Tax=Macrococcus epidermidis TaxID=1902580 RepID=UPI001EF238C5|nr:methyltransferase domain-containing protein [Macrococcus epidermidis]MCG7420358.1 methyltransferase domain-containing protein [Macrococcus epidermidis]